MTREERGGLPARRFADDEVRDILRRASVREAGVGLPSPHDPTLPDLMAAAAEAGMDPAEVRRAAAVDVHRGGSFTGVVLGAPDRRHVSAHLPAAGLPPDTRALVRQAEEALGVGGTVHHDTSDLFEWRSHRVGSRGRLALRVRDGGLEVEASLERAGSYAGLWFLGLVAWAALSATTPLGALPLAGKVLAFLLTPPLLVRPFWAASDRRAREKLERLVLDVLRLADTSPRPEP